MHCASFSPQHRARLETLKPSLSWHVDELQVATGSSWLRVAVDGTSVGVSRGQDELVAALSRLRKVMKGALDGRTMRALLPLGAGGVRMLCRQVNGYAEIELGGRSIPFSTVSELCAWLAVITGQPFAEHEGGTDDYTPELLAQTELGATLLGKVQLSPADLASLRDALLGLCASRDGRYACLNLGGRHATLKAKQRYGRLNFDGEFWVDLAPCSMAFLAADIDLLLSPAA